MYAVDLSSLAGSQLAATFVPSQRDGTTDRFLATAARDGCDASKLAAAKRDRTRFVHAQRLRGWSRTDASAAFLNMSLLVASPAQLRRVLAPALAAASGSRSQGRTTAAAAVAAAAPSAALTLLDIGAGRGEATAALASALGVRAQDVTVMEAAAQARRSYNLLLTTCYLLLTTYYLLPAQIRRRLTAERGYRAVSSFAELGAGQTFLQLTTCYLLLATCYLLLTTCYLLLATYYLLLTTYYSAQARRSAPWPCSTCWIGATTLSLAA